MEQFNGPQMASETASTASSDGAKLESQMYHQLRKLINVVVGITVTICPYKFSFCFFSISSYPPEVFDRAPCFTEAMSQGHCGLQLPDSGPR